MYRDLENFEELYEGASNQEKKLLIRALIFLKKVSTEPKGYGLYNFLV